MFIGAVLFGTSLGYVAAGIALAIGLSLGAAALVLIGTGVTVTVLLLGRMSLCNGAGDDGPTPPRRRFRQIGAETVHARSPLHGAAIVASLTDRPRSAVRRRVPRDGPKPLNG